MKKSRVVSLTMAIVALTLSMCSGKNSSDKTSDSSVVFTAKTALPYQDIAIETVNGKTSFKAEQFNRISGEPQLPVVPVTLTIPADGDLAQVEVVIENESEVELPGTYDIDGALPATFDGSIMWPKNKNIVNGRDQDVYGADAFYPSSYAGKINTGKLREYKLVEVSVFPYRYNPVTKKLRKLTGGDIVIHTPRNLATDRDAVNVPVKNTALTNRLASISANYKQASNYYNTVNREQFNILFSTSVSVADYVIITTTAIKNASTQLNAFVAQKQSKGFKVKVVTEADWGGGTGDTASEKIRTWLKNNYINLGIEYVLLIGNPDPVNGDVPMKMAWPRWNAGSTDPYRDAPTDYYYAELSGNWDLDGDGKFGEEDDDRVTGKDGADAYAELMVGRFPYYGVIADLDGIIAKTIAYETDTNTAWRKNALLPMKPLDASTSGYQLGENIKDNVLVTNGWAYTRIYDLLPSAPVSEYSPCSETNVISAMNNANYGLMVWLTHGWSQGASDVISTTSLDSLNASAIAHPVFTWHGSCLNAYPEQTDNIAYSLLKKGAVVTTAATRVSWYWVGESDFTSTSSCGGMGYQYAKNLVQNHLSAGEALSYSRSNTSAYILWMNYLVFNTYGDPSLKIIPNSAGTPVLSLDKSSVTLTGVKANSTVVVPVTCFNIGAGELNVTSATSDSALLTPVVSGRTIAITVNTANLTANNVYSGTVTVVSNGGSAVVPVSFTVADAFKTKLGTGVKLYLTGASFNNWNAASASHELKLVNDYTWELKVNCAAALANTPYKITDGTWTVNWGAGATGKDASLARGGNNASVSLGAFSYTLRITEGATINDPIHVQWIGPSRNLVVHFKEWGSATAYIIHPWGGLTGDITMTYEGQYNGSYWWVATIQDAPTDFMFTFTNSSNQWEGSSAYDRHYTDQALEIYVQAKNATIYTYRP